MPGEMRIRIEKDGPYMVSGGVPLMEEVLKRDPRGGAESWMPGATHQVDGEYALCRCGRSAERPFCTGVHDGFDGTETAKRNTFDERARTYCKGGGVELLQDPSLCVGDGFCHGRRHIEDNIRDKRTMGAALEQTYFCSGGSLVIKIDGVKQEPELDRCISATSAPPKKGPLWAKGGIPVESSDGYVYEVRNRVALCGCGRSRNKPFCDASHMR